MDRQLCACCSLTVIILMTSWSRVNSFNLDVDYPIIFEDHSYERGYFGYTVGMYSNVSGSWILIGAPRANYTDQRYRSIKEPGTVYECSLTSIGKCDPIDLFSGESYSIPDENSSAYSDDKYLDLDKPFPDNGFMGGSMTIQEGPKGRLAVCGHKTTFKFETENIYGHLGYCFWRYLGGDVMEPISPFKSPSYEDAKSSPYGAAGFSIAMTELRNSTDPRRLIFGVPGFHKHKGAINIVRDSSGTDKARQRREISSSDFSKDLGFLLYGKLNKTALDDNELFGYQVAVGKIGKNKRFILFVSAPRANNLRGAVMGFYISREKKMLIPEILYSYFGNQIGEYYGASIAVGDLNDDESDDIIIGAPFYTAEKNHKGKAFDEGRIEVRLSKPNAYQIFEEGKAVGGRFGYAVSFLGRLCPDEPPKIGVAAPNEDEGRGVVYIYSYDAEKLTETQRLVAKHLYSRLQGCGSYIITHPVDIDANKVADVAVGAYKSGHAVIFRGKPVVQWNTKMISKNETIAPYSNIFSFESCITFQGIEYIEKVEVERFLDLDPDHQRCHLNGRNNNSAVITVYRWKERCELFNVTLEKSNNFQPLKVTVYYSLKEEKNNKTKVLVIGGKVTGYDNFCKTCPTTKPILPLVKEYPFAHDCGDDNICTSDLIVDGVIPILSENSDENDVPYLVGANKDLELIVIVQNKKGAEKSYKPYITIILPSGIDIQQFYRGECDKVDSPEGCNFHIKASDQLYMCDVGGVTGGLMPGEEETLEISLDPTNLHGSPAENITICAASASKEVNNTDNFKSIPVHFKYIADIAITGITETEQFNFIDKKATAENLVNLNHIYEVQKFGISPVEEVMIEIFVPYAIEDYNGNLIEFLTLKYEGTQNGESISCNSLLVEDGSTSDRRRRSINDESTSEVNLKNITAAQAPSNRTLYLNCSSLEESDHPEIKCIKVKCSSLPLKDNQEVSRVVLSMTLNAESLNKAKKEKDIILLETFGKVAVVKPKVLDPTEKDRPDLMWTSTMLIGDIPAGKVAIWIIILAIIVGILLLALLGFGLYKAGFFERKKREELDSLKNQISTNEDFAVDS